MIKKRFGKLPILIVAAMLITLVMSIAPLAATNNALSGPPVVYVSDCLVQPGDTVTINICIENNPGITDATLTLTVDEGLTLTKVEAGEALSTLEFTAPENVGQANAYTFSWSGAEADAGNGVALVLTFNVPADAVKGTVYDLDLSADGEYDIFDGQIEVIDYIPGDVDGNGEVNGDDVTALRQYITGGYGVTINVKAGDVNNDGKLNGNDVTLIRQKIVGGYDVTLRPSTKCLEHTLTKVDAEAPTCTENGNTEYWMCANCNKYYRDENGNKAISLERTVVEATGHTLDLETLECKDCESGRLNGLYDADGKVVKTWEELLALGLDITSNYTEATAKEEGAKSAYGVLDQFADGIYLVLPDDGTVTTIGAYAFADCANLYTVYAPEGVTAIGTSAFTGSGIRSFTFPSTVTAYANNIFTNCEKLTYVKLNDKVTWINTQMFSNCTSLETITIPSVVNLIGNAVFRGCNNLKTVIFEGTLPRVGIKPGSNSVFTAEGIHLIINAAEVDMLADAKVSGTQRYSLDKYASNFTKITLGENVTSIQTDIFQNFNDLESISFDGTVEEWTALNMGTSWYNGVELTKLTCTDGEICLHVFDTFAQCTREGCTYRLAAGLYDEEGKLLKPWTELGLVVNPSTAYSSTSTDATYYQTTAGSGYYTVKRAESEYAEMTGLTIVLPVEEKVIGAYLFYGCDNISGICISPETTSIGAAAFWSTKITSFVIPASLEADDDGKKWIKEHTFRLCDQLTSITDLAGVTNIGTRAFQGCTSLTEVYFPCETKVNIGNDAFRESAVKTLKFKVWPGSASASPFSSLTGLTLIIEDGTVEGLSAFTTDGKSNFMKAISSIEFGKGVTSIGGSAFKDCTALTSVTFAADGALSDIGNSAFRGAGITSIVVPDNVVTINNYAFYGCSSLVSAVIGKNCATTLSGSHMFEGCVALETVEFGEGITKLQYQAFKGCTSLKSITLPSTLEALNGTEGFIDCTSLTSITIPASVTTITGNTFKNCTSLKTVTFEGMPSSITATAFAGCTDIHFIFNSETIVKSTAIAGKAYVVAVTVGENVTSIEAGAFLECANLASVTLGANVKTIGANAFNGTAITEITLPVSVESIEINAFKNCTSLATINFAGTVEQWNAIEKGDAWNANAPATKVVCDGGEVCLHVNVTILEKTDATCTDSGLTEGKVCSDCETTLVAQETIEALGHKEVTEPGQNATCTENGLTDKVYCEVCEEVFAEHNVILAPGHTYDNDDDADCNVCGEIRLVGCQHEHTSEIPPQAPTCTTTGFTAGLKCDDCEAVLEAPEVIDATGHAWGEVTYTWSDDHTTCTATRVCGNDGEHVDTESAESVCTRVEPGCETTGTATYVATFTNEAFAEQTYEETLAVTGHAIVPVDAKAPTCTEAGYDAYEYCTNCDYTTFSEVPALGHAYDTFAQCTREGCEYRLPAGLYDKDGNLLKTWDELGILVNPSTAYTDSTFETAETSAYYVLTREGSEYADMTNLMVVVPMNETKLGNYAFRKCTNVSTICISPNTTSVGQYAFAYSGIEKFVYPETVAAYQSYTFYGCASLTSVKLNNAAKWIATQMFRQCSSLKEIVIPAVVTQMGGAAFKETGITTIAFEGVIPEFRYLPSNTNNIFGGNTGLHLILTATDVKQDTALSTNYVLFSQYAAQFSKITFGANVETIDAGIFDNFTKVTEIVFEGDSTQWNTENNDKLLGAQATYITCADGVKICIEHVYNVENATCTEDKVCTVCGLFVAEKLGHTEGEVTVEKEVAPGCVTDGSYDNVVYCVTCNAVLSRETVPVPATGHSHTPVVTPPTCTEDGYTTHTCACGDTYITDTVPATGHSYKTEVTEPTCIDIGYTTYTCDCGDTYVDNEVDALGHTAPNAEGKCDRCQLVLGHVHVYDAAVVNPAFLAQEASCQTPARYYYSCSVEGCGEFQIGETFVDMNGPVLGHNMQPATCTERSKCSRCSAAFGSALGHSFTTSITCDREGCEKTLDKGAGLYKSDGTQIATWAELVEAGFDITAGHADTATAKAAENSGWTVLHENETYFEGTILVIDSSITEIGKYAIAACNQLKAVVIPSSVTKISERAFNNCTGLVKIALPESVTTVEQYAFKGCSSLVEITLHGAIAGNVVSECPKLEKITLGADVTIGNANAFKVLANTVTTSKLVDVVFLGTEDEWTVAKGSNWAGARDTCYLTVNGVRTNAGHSIGTTNVCTRCGETIAPGLYDANGKLVATWAELIAAGVNVSKDYTSNTDATRPMAILATQFATGTQLVLPEDETIIGAFVFAADNASTNNTLTKVIFSPHTTKLGTGIFTYSKIKTVVIPAGVTEVPAKMFNLATVETVLFEGNVTKINDSAFRQCKYLTTLKFGNYENFEIPYGITEINGDAANAANGLFNTATKVTTIIIPVTVTKIGYRAFYSGTGSALMTLETIIYRGTMAQWNAIEKLGTSNNSWDYQLTKLKRIVCSDGIICVTYNSTSKRPVYGEHTFVEGVCSNCGVTPCEDAGGHTVVDGTCTICGKTGCEELGHTWTGEITCKSLEYCSVCQAVRGTYAEHSWNKTEATQIGDTLTCSVCGKTEVHYIDTNNNLNDKLNEIPIATPETPNSELRDIAVQLMKAQFSFVYKADMSQMTTPVPVYAYYIENLFAQKSYQNKWGDDPAASEYTIEDGSYFGGIPYTGNAVGSVYRWTRFYDSVTGTMNMAPVIQSANTPSTVDVDRFGFRKPQYKDSLTDLNIGSAVFGNSCSSSVFWGWARFSNDMTSPWTHGWLPSRGYVPVGQYEIVYNAAGQIDFVATIEGDDGILGFGAITPANTAETMFKAYAQLLKADGMVQDGHAVMVAYNPVVVYDANGNIDGNASYVIIIEQAGGWRVYNSKTEEQFSRLKDKNGNFVLDAEGNNILYQMMPNQPDVEKSKYGEYEDQTKYVTWTFQKLYNEGFLPFTTAELAGIKEVEASEATLNHKGDTISVSEMESLYVRSNYYISDVGFTVKDSEGKVVFKGVYADERESVSYMKNASLNIALNGNVLYESYTYIKDQLNYFAGEGYTIEIDCVLSTGETKTVYTGTLVK